MAVFVGRIEPEDALDACDRTLCFVLDHQGFPIGLSNKHTCISIALSRICGSCRGSCCQRIVLLLIQQEIPHLPGPGNRIIGGIRETGIHIGGVQPGDFKAAFHSLHPESIVGHQAVTFKIITRHAKRCLQRRCSRFVQAVHEDLRAEFRKRESVGLPGRIRVLLQIQRLGPKGFRQQRILRGIHSLVSGQRILFPYHAQLCPGSKACGNPADRIGDFFKTGNLGLLPVFRCNFQAGKRRFPHRAVTYGVKTQHIGHRLLCSAAASVSIVIPVNREGSGGLRLLVFHRYSTVTCIHLHLIAAHRRQVLHLRQMKGIRSVNDVQIRKNKHTALGSGRLHCQRRAIQIEPRSEIRRQSSALGSYNRHIQCCGIQRRGNRPRYHKGIFPGNIVKCQFSAGDAVPAAFSRQTLKHIVSPRKTGNGIPPLCTGNGHIGNLHAICCIHTDIPADVRISPAVSSIFPLYPEVSFRGSLFRFCFLGFRLLSLGLLGFRLLGFRLLGFRLLGFRLLGLGLLGFRLLGFRLLGFRLLGFRLLGLGLLSFRLLRLLRRGFLRYRVSCLDLRGSLYRTGFPRLIGVGRKRNIGNQ